MVVSSLKFCPLWTHDRKVPLKQIVLGENQVANVGNTLYQIVYWDILNDLLGYTK